MESKVGEKKKNVSEVPALSSWAYRLSMKISTTSSIQILMDLQPAPDCLSVTGRQRVHDSAMAEDELHVDRMTLKVRSKCVFLRGQGEGSRVQSICRSHAPLAPKNSRSFV